MRAFLILSLIALSFSAFTLSVNKILSTDQALDVNYADLGCSGGQTVTKLEVKLNGQGTLVAEVGTTNAISGVWWKQAGEKSTYLNGDGSLVWTFSSSDQVKATSDAHFKFSVYYGNAKVKSIEVTTSDGGSGSGSYSGSSSSDSGSSSSSGSQSSSTATEVNLGGKCPSLKVISGGVSGHGYATRYWDCCKPSCSWPNNAGGNPSRHCSKSGQILSDPNASSVCDGGVSMTCTSQIPFTIDGCDNMGFAFAAVPGNTPMCGRCFVLTFNGEGKYETKANHQALKGKKLLVMASNIGYDVAGGQFDVMIPGGGVGIFNGCAGVMSTAGQTYGGILSDCENEVGYSGDLLTLRKNCLKQKCQKEFGNHADGLAGCLFLANFMQAAGNPQHDYVEVECPDFMKAKY